jgi:hypothetical protein
MANYPNKKAIQHDFISNSKTHMQMQKQKNPPRHMRVATNAISSARFD